MKYPVMALFAIAIGWTTNVLGQTCTEGTGPLPASVATSGHSAVGQSFTANCAGGEITAITLYWDVANLGPTADRQLNIYDGPDWTSAVLHTLVIPYASIVNGPNTFPIVPPVPISAAEVNSFEITAVGGGTAGNIANGVLYTDSDSYAAGSPFWGRSAYPAFDLLFDVELNGSAEIQRGATFKVTKTFSERNNNAEVDVTLTCNSGLPLEQNFTIAGGDPDGVTFVVTDIPETGADCEVTESGGPPGYDVLYNGTADGCTWTDVMGGDSLTCFVSNTAQDATFTVVKDWVLDGSGGDIVDREAEVTIICDRPILGVEGDFGLWRLTDTLLDGEELEAKVDVTQGSAYCAAFERTDQSGVESTSDCDETQLGPGESFSCTITNTVFFEGIPTLSQYGLAILALLMLGVGFVGMRRFV